MEQVTDSHTLHRENVRVAWSFAHRLRADQFDRLCEVTLNLWREDRAHDDGAEPLPG